jgi:hypothetical protein
MRTLLISALLLAASPALAQEQPALDQQLPVQQAEVIGRFKAPEATQGVAVDAKYFYAVANSRIAKYDKASGRKVAEWQGERARYPHINSCAVIEAKLVCASSNFPQTPQQSTVEIFEPKTMTHEKTISLGQQIGSVTWVDRKDGFWWATFANYDGKGGEAGRDHRYTTFVKFDDQWRRTEAWTFPAEVLARFKPMSSSGGGWGDDGLLYITGHDHPELYVLKLPKGGATLDHVGTIAVPIEGQAIAWDKSQKRVVYGISRPNREVVAMRVPALAK